jgi:hypothetical protein
MTRNQEIRHECLLQLYGSREIAISAELIRKVAQREGMDYDAREISGALFFLRGQGFCEQVTEGGTGEVRHRITSAGMLYWENRRP